MERSRRRAGAIEPQRRTALVQSSHDVLAEAFGQAEGVPLSSFNRAMSRQAAGRATVGDDAAGDATIAAALSILAARLRKPGAALETPHALRQWIALRLAECQHEVFAVLFLDGQHGVIDFEPMFRGTLTQTSVYPREIVKRALALNAAAVILAHNHPSSCPEPSRNDELVTQWVARALSLVDVSVLDHIIVGGMSTVSLAERGLL